ncbi:MAG: prephenate dehydrogenase [Alkalimonas sp.]|nr:prephenate dehydrogenase [Alkalimonas sp.]
MEQLLDQLDANLKELYRKALDADQALDALKKQGQGKHQAIFPASAGFQQQSDRFMPYLAETAELVAAMRQSQQFNTATLQRAVQQLKQLHQTLLEFQQAVKP